MSITNPIDLEGLPLQRELGAYADEVVRPDEPASLWALEPVLEELVRSGRISQLVDACLRERGEARGGRGLYVLPDRMLLAAGPHYQLALRVLDVPELPTPREVVSASSCSLQMVLGPGRLVTERFVAGPGWPWESLRGHHRVRLVDIVRTAAGQRIRLDARREVVRQRTEGALAMLTLVGAPVRTMRWAFDVSTGRPLRAIAAASESTRLQLVADMLDHLGDPVAIPTLVGLCDHPGHAVRWSAIQALLNLDYAKGREQLARALHDPHPDLRVAARASLAQLEPDAGAA